MTRKHLLTLLLLMTLSVGLAFGQVYFNYMGMESINKQSARSLAVGSNALALEQNPVAGFNNPATLFSTTDAFKIYANLNTQSFIERRAFPVQDSFGDFLAENDYVSNRFQGFEGDLAMYYSQKGFSLSAGWFTLNNLNYQYREEIRSDLGSGAYSRDPLAGLHLIDFSGYNHGLNIALAHDIGNRFAIGYAYTRYFTSGISEGFGVIPILNDPKLSSKDTTFFAVQPTHGNGSNINLGLTAKVTERLTLGLSSMISGHYSLENTKMTVNIDSTLLLPAYSVSADSSYDLKMNRPNTYSLSVRYIPANELKTVLFAQFDLINWKSYGIAYFDAADSLVLEHSPKFSPSWAFRAGVEHQFFTGVPLRFGFAYEENPMSKEMNRMTINLGSGWSNDHVTLDFGLGIYQNMYYYNDLFPVEGEVRASRDKVKEQGLRGNLSLSYSF
ncbi:MAG: hypothetical protein WCT23_09990 [Candidatus Neomarinimicrobiota bacterium]